LDWAIIGGESGHGARPMEPKWVDKILKICRRADVAFFFKQWGGVHKSATGRLLHGKTYDEMPARTVMPMLQKNERISMAKAYESKTLLWQPSLRVKLPSSRNIERRIPSLA